MPSTIFSYFSEFVLTAFSFLNFVFKIEMLKRAIEARQRKKAEKEVAVARKRKRKDN